MHRPRLSVGIIEVHCTVCIGVQVVCIDTGKIFSGYDALLVYVVVGLFCLLEGYAKMGEHRR